MDSQLEEDIDKMMASWIEPEKLAIQHVGNACQWVPVIGMTISKSPSYPVDRQTTGHFGIFINVPVIIVVNEIVAKRLTEDQPCDCG